MCLSCPVKQKCLDYAIKHNEPYGIWGGMTVRDRERKKRNDRRRRRVQRS